MPLTRIEQYIFGGNRAHFVTAVGFRDETFTVKLVPIDKRSTDRETVAIFRNAAMLNVSKDTSEHDEWPLDIIGFDCYDEQGHWTFVLNCGTTEWIWQSDWPSLQR